MSSDVAIKVENLGKAYRIGLKEQQHETMLGALAAWVKSPFENYRSVRNLSQFKDATTVVSSQSSGGPPSDILWALKDVSFEVKHGEAVGIIGRNGAGKSTLLKILSRITEPTSGRAGIYGRVGSLLEVGTGFHPDLTGRENVYLNGTILGMKKREVAAKFDEIVDFSGVEKFIDTPVKRYSSGMRVRLAFSVAAHLEPEILVIDEVLAVGDAEFQKRCLGKMGDVTTQGRTVLFVSHNMSAVSQLCDRCFVLSGGEVSFEGKPDEGINYYAQLGNRGSNGNSAPTVRVGGRSPHGKARILRVQVQDEAGNSANCFGIGEPFRIQLHVQFLQRIPRVALGAEFESSAGLPLLNLRNDGEGKDCGPYEAGATVVFNIGIPGLPFYPGVFPFRAWFAERDGRRIDQIDEGLSVTLESRGRFRSERMIQPGRGLVLLDCNWSEETPQ
jgi:lipopolysaccharide transport system ATP-binding protein